ncbi:hypothetical protein [Shewanella marisflavi]|uniref:hypothetical protein n=1 Tax=Shewanella marisflavi TaxID=260364 RepID=UPI003AAC2D08
MTGWIILVVMVLSIVWLGCLFSRETSAARTLQSEGHEPLKVVAQEAYQAEDESDLWKVRSCNPATQFPNVHLAEEGLEGLDDFHNNDLLDHFGHFDHFDHLNRFDN